MFADRVAEVRQTRARHPAMVALGRPGVDVAGAVETAVSLL